MDTQNYKQAVVEMNVVMRELFEANQKFQRLSQIVWDWDKMPSPIAEVPSPLLPRSPPSEPEERLKDQPCGCRPTAWKSCPHECSICLKALTLKDSEGMCFECEKDLVDIPKLFPADAAEAKRNSAYSEGAFHALILRIRANGCRGSAIDMEDAEEVRNYLHDAERLDDIASHLLYTKADYTFKPWWFARWSYPLPESLYAVRAPVPEPKPVCGCCKKIKEDTLGYCKLCERPLTCCHVSKDDEFACFVCEDDLRTVREDYPEDAAEAKAVGASAFHALVLRIQANNNREAAFDTENQVERAQCISEAGRLDCIATGILKNNAPAFKPWWRSGWHYWKQPGSMHEVPKWAPKEVEHAVPPAGCYTSCSLMHTPNDTFLAGLCRQEPDWQALWREAAAEAVPYAPSKAKTTKPDYNHKFWPSPRPKLFAKACVPKGTFPTHQDALEFLAYRANITVTELLTLEPDNYITKHMGNNPPAFWKRGITKNYF